MGEMMTISEDELREQLWASGNGVDPTRLTALADDALRQARHRQRTLRTVTTLSVALVVAAVGVTASTVASHSGRTASVSTTSTAVGQRGLVELVTPIWFMPVKSVSTGACNTANYSGPTGAEATTTTACYHVDADGAMSVNAVAGIEATRVPTLDGGDVGWEVNVTFPGAARTAYAKLTAETVNRQLAVIVDDEVLNAPVIAETITTGTVQITGFDTQQSATNLVDQLTGR
jgi:hypothetical protein